MSIFSNVQSNILALEADTKKFDSLIKGYHINFSED